MRFTSATPKKNRATINPVPLFIDPIAAMTTPHMIIIAGIHIFGPIRWSIMLEGSSASIYHYPIKLVGFIVIVQIKYIHIQRKI